MQNSSLFLEQLLISAIVTRYMEALYHIIIMAIAEYPVHDSGGKQVGSVTCSLYDRIWCAFEMAIRDCLAVRELRHQKSEVVILDEMAKEVVSGAISESYIAAKISECFRKDSLFDRLQGYPADVAKIKALLVSDAFYGSKEAFEEKYRKRMVKLLAENMPQVRRTDCTLVPPCPAAVCLFPLIERAACSRQFLTRCV